MITTLVVPTLGRPSLGALLSALESQTRPVDAPIILVDDRPDGEDLVLDTALDLRVIRTGGGGPAHARNVGWRHARTPWVSFLDDDVVPEAGWYDALLVDLAAAEADIVGIVGSQGRVRVPLPRDRRPTDWERGTAGLEEARWITADLSYRRSALSRVGGFDERFTRAFREDADLALRLGADTGRVLVGERQVAHPVRPVDDWVSARQQAGNADDVLMTQLHGHDWHERAEAAVGRRWAHVAITALGAATVGAVLSGRQRLACLVAAGWAGGTAELAASRIVPGPRDPAEVRRMTLTSIAIPPLATWHLARGLRRHLGARPWRGLPELVLLDRDGTLVEDVPYNGDPTQVRPLPGVREALDRLREQGVRLAVVTNQSGIGRGLLTAEQVDAVDARVAELLGPFEAIYRCPHTSLDGCTCRKPEPGLVKQALADTGVRPGRTVLIGDIGSDMGAARAAGVTGVLVPTAVTLPEEVEEAAHVAGSLAEAVEDILGGRW